MSIDAFFYTNVFLLMQVVPPSFECRKYFKQGMFDKSNSAGFIYISHYLLSIYDPIKFQTIVPWPLMNKKDESQYRLKFKEYLDIVATENSDLNFPSILMIHIMRAAGTRFLSIMWKLSQISLRSYIARHHNGTLLLTPDTGDTSNISRMYITNINLERNSTISKLLETAKLAMMDFEDYMQYYHSVLKNIQTAVFQTKENIRRCIQVTPVNEIVIKRLSNSKDTEIINLWKANIYANIEHLNYAHSYLNNLKSISSKIVDTFSSICTNPKTLNLNNLPVIDTEVLQQVFNNNREHLDSGMYTNSCLAFHSLLLILSKTLKQIECCLPVDKMSHLSNCVPVITECNQMLKSMEEVMQNFILEAGDVSCNLKSSLQDKTFQYTIQNDFFYSICQKVLCEDPKFQFCFNESLNSEKSAIKNELYMSPEKGKYKHLFARYKKEKSPKRSLSISSFINSSESKSTDWVSPKRSSLSCRSSPNNNKKVSPRYTKLFSPRRVTKRYTGNCAASSSKLDDSPRSSNNSPKCSNQIDPKAVNLVAAIQNIYDLSNKITEIAASLSKS